MPWQEDRNIGRCSFHTCRMMGVPRCDGFMCGECCTSHHATWDNHRRPDGTVLPAVRSPVRYNGHSDQCVCVACKRDRVVVPVEWDYDTHPPEFGDAAELGEDYERCFIPLNNCKANNQWLVDYIG